MHEYNQSMERYWLLTNTCYGNWLPGDSRGFVGQVWEHREGDDKKPRVRHSLHGTPYDERIPGLQQQAATLLKCPPIHLTLEQAQVLLQQFRETAIHRRWEILAIAIMYNHFHIVVGVPGDPSPAKILGDFKAWGTRTLSARFGEPPSKTWWTERGSKRKLDSQQAIGGGVDYVLYRQPSPLVVWSPASVEP